MPWSNPWFLFNLLNEDLPPGPRALSKTFTEFFLFKRFAIVDPEIPDPIMQYSLIYQLQPYPQSSWLESLSSIQSLDH